MSIVSLFVLEMQIINEVAAKFGWGGHALASGATLSSLDQLEDLLSSLHDAISMI